MAEIVWQDRAVAEFEAIQEYLIRYHGESQVRKFTKRVFQFLDLLQTHPSIGPLQHKKLDIRGFVLSRQTTIIYKLVNDKIHILAFVDNRSDHLFSNT